MRKLMPNSSWLSVVAAFLAVCLAIQSTDAGQTKTVDGPYMRLFEAIRTHNGPVIREALAAKINVNEPIEGPDSHFPPLLHHACLAGCPLDIIKSIVDAGADVNLQVRADAMRMDHCSVPVAGRLDIVGGGTPLMAALYGESMDVVKYLRARGARVTAGGPTGATPLFAAVCAIREWREKSRMLLRLGANINARNRCGETPLFSAVSAPMGPLNDIVERYRFLIAHGARPDVRDNGRVTCLMLAAGNHQVPTVVPLFTRRVQIDAEDANGRTALLYATEGANLSTARELIRRGANVNHQDHDGKTALMWATLNAGLVHADLRIVQLLREHGANPDLQTPSGMTALSYAEQTARHAGNTDAKTYNPTLYRLLTDPQIGVGPKKLH